MCCLVYRLKSISVVYLPPELVKSLGERRLENLFMKIFAEENGKHNILFKSVNSYIWFEEVIPLFH